jgi:hypothetical protein
MRYKFNELILEQQKFVNLILPEWFKSIPFCFRCYIYNIDLIRMNFYRILECAVCDVRRLFDLFESEFTGTITKISTNMFTCMGWNLWLNNEIWSNYWRYTSHNSSVAYTDSTLQNSIKVHSDQINIINITSKTEWNRTT